MLEEGPEDEDLNECKRYRSGRYPKHKPPPLISRVCTKKIKDSRNALNSVSTLSYMHAIHLSRLGRVALHTSSVRGARAVNNAPRALVNGKWEAVVGLEVHAQIDSRTKLFSGKWAYKCVVGNYATKDVNSLVSLVSVFALSIPDIVQRACEHQCVRYRRSVPRRVASECHGRSIRRSTCVDLAVMTALALKADVHLRSSFDRKHYFYPDLPQGYQITQHYEPISTGGLIALTELDGVSYPLEVRVEQLQLEQDTGKSLYDMVPGITLVDLNRAGTGLMEIVTRPDMRCIVVRGGIGGEEDAGTAAVCWIVEWEYGRGGCAFGSMRCDVNVSVHEVDTPFGTRCELKNLNSVRFLTMAIGEWSLGSGKLWEGEEGWITIALTAPIFVRRRGPTTDRGSRARRHGDARDEGLRCRGRQNVSTEKQRNRAGL
ncbi:hypothetical protein BC936DRAFT_145128 [Jimgerdemannia flammicorona]|uniref:Aspartyl/Glutamyl-tRNA(Gln) amidotransferase subunit B/E catalytic domain-containing protein n=1 Tax=Jimgerdemannia flammicorona TaxID=994334 RepID=A0A433DAU3_9FUNG|nr:hypothetical protein BC936DRAFT_145128 [Jimgerdemannia flammicorona]